VVAKPWYSCGGREEEEEEAAAAVEEEGRARAGGRREGSAADTTGEKASAALLTARRATRAQKARFLNVAAIGSTPRACSAGQPGVFLLTTSSLESRNGDSWKCL